MGRIDIQNYILGLVKYIHMSLYLFRSMASHIQYTVVGYPTPEAGSTILPISLRHDYDRGVITIDRRHRYFLCDRDMGHRYFKILNSTRVIHMGNTSALYPEPL